MSEQEISFWRQRYAALTLELSGVEDLIAAEKEHGYAYSVEFWTQRRRAILTEMRAIEGLLARVDGGEDGRVAHRLSDQPVMHDRRKRDPRRVKSI